MTSRVLVYPGSTPLDTDILNVQTYSMEAIGGLIAATLGNGPWVDGLTLAATSTPSMTVTVAPGCIFSLQTVEATPFGSLGTNSAPLNKVGQILTPTSFVLTAPSTAGQSVNYLIEASFSETDANPVALPYYNAANPSQPYTGPNNSGAVQNTTRTQTVALQLKAGAAAPAGSQSTPAVDVGWVPLYVVTVNYGQSTVSSAQCAASTAPGAPFIGTKLPYLTGVIEAWVAANYLPLTGGTLTGALTCNTTLYVTGTITAQNLLHVAGAAVVDKTLTVTQDVLASSTLHVNGISSLHNTNVNGQATISYDFVAFDGNAFNSNLVLIGDVGSAATAITFCVPNTPTSNYNAFKMGNAINPQDGSTTFILASYANSDPTGQAKLISGTFIMDHAGNVTVSGYLTQGSDRTEKENIVEVADDYLSKINDLHTYSYNRIGQPRQEIGIMAQDVQAVIPEAVIADANGKLRVDSLCLISTMMSAIRELNTRIAVLEAKPKS